MNGSTTPNSRPTHYSSGKLLIAALLALGVAAGVGSWTYYARLQRRPIDFWGSETVRLIARAPQAESLRLEAVATASAESTGERLVVGTKSFVSRDERDVMRSPGFSNIRAALLNSTSFGDTIELVRVPPTWRYALKFSDGSSTATLVFSEDGKWTAASGGELAISLEPAALEFASFFREQFPTPHPSLLTPAPP